MEISVPKHHFSKKMKGERVSMICPKHGYKRGSVCDECEKEINKGSGSVNISIFKPMVYEDICETPLLIESKRQLKEACKVHNVTAARLL